MRNYFIFLLVLTFVLLSGTAFASPSVDFNKGAFILEAGSTLNAKVSGNGRHSINADGKSGYIYAITAGLGHNLALQFKQGKFQSANASLMGITTYAQAEPTDVNLLYKVNPQLTFISGYEHDNIYYGQAVAAASKSAFHFGLTGTHNLSRTTSLFATYLAGNGVSLSEVGVSYKLSANSTLSVSYAERKFENMAFNIPAYAYSDQVNYTMNGITCVMAVKL
jgi:predicted porin